MPMKHRLRLMLVLFALTIPGAILFLITLQPPEVPGVDPMVIRIAAVVSNVMFTIVLGALGSFASPAVGFETPAITAALQGRSPWPILRERVRISLIGALIALAVLVLGDLAFRPEALAGPAKFPSILQMLLGMTYGGLIEEIGVRWGLMGIWAWLVYKVTRSQTAGAWVGIIVAAVAFGGLHLPALLQTVGSEAFTPVLIVRTVLLNAAGGIVFGWLFWKKGLEAAMMSHAFVHVGLFLVNVGIYLAMVQG